MFESTSISGHAKQDPPTKSTQVQISPERSNDRLRESESAQFLNEAACEWISEGEYPILINLQGT